MMGPNWGLKQKILEWIYMGIVRPIVSYGCIVWLYSLKQKGILKDLTKLQRKACLMITRGMNSTPTAGMEAILGLEPLDIHLKGIALSTYARIKNAEN